MMYMKITMLICTKKKSSSISFWTRAVLIRTPYLQPINGQWQKRNLISGGNQNHCHFCSWWWRQRLSVLSLLRIADAGKRSGWMYRLGIWQMNVFSCEMVLITFSRFYKHLAIDSHTQGKCSMGKPDKTWQNWPVSSCLSYCHRQMCLIWVSCDNFWEMALRNRPRNGCCISRFNLPLVKIWPNSIQTFRDKK